MSNTIKKSVLCDLVSRHNSFDFEHYISTTKSEDYDTWNSYCLPMDYGNAKNEYSAIRSSCAMFDASPMKKYRLRGNDAGLFLDKILTSPMSQLPAMRSAYGLICNGQGLLLDDGIVNKYSDDDYLLLISEIDFDEYFKSLNTFDNLTITDETSLLAGIALQGPKSCKVLSEFGLKGIENLKPFELKYYKIKDHTILVGRVGFTGDLGYELWFKPDAISAVELTLNEAEKSLGIEILGYGLTALQICRIEAGMIVPGWDTAGEFTDPKAERTPYELTLGWNVKLNGDEDFIGKAALIEHKDKGPRFTMKGFKVPGHCHIEEGQAIYTNIDVRRVQIGTLPSLVRHTDNNNWIGLASLEIAFQNVDNVYIVDTGIEINCQICQLPFINLAHRTEVPAKL
jgi:aminomethyltransferase